MPDLHGAGSEHGCTCGHKPMFCHKLNAGRWCGVDIEPRGSYWEGLARGLAVAQRAIDEGRPIPPIEDFE